MADMARPGVAGVHVPYSEEIVREWMGVPVVVRYRPWTPLDAHRRWRRFGGRHG